MAGVAGKGWRALIAGMGCGPGWRMGLGLGSHFAVGDVNYNINSNLGKEVAF